MTPTRSLILAASKELVHQKKKDGPKSREIVKNLITHEKHNTCNETRTGLEDDDFYFVSHGNKEDLSNSVNRFTRTTMQLWVTLYKDGRYA